MKEIRLTVFTFEKKSLSEFQVGEKVTIEKDKGNEFDEFAMKVTFPDGITNGFVGNKSTTTVTNVTGGEVYSELPDKFEAVIDGIHTGSIKNRTALSVKVSLKTKKKVIGEDIIELPFKGTYKKYSKKSEVMHLIQDGEQPIITLKEEKDEIVGCYKDGLIGKLNEDFVDITQISTLKAFIQNSNKDVVGKAIKLEINNRKDIIVQVKINRQDKKDAESSSKGSVKSIDTLIDEVVDKGIATKEKCESVLEYLNKYSVSERIIRKVFSSYKEYPDDIKMLIPSPTTLYDDYLGLIKKNLLYINIKKHLRLVGGKGTGKNKLVETLAWIYNRPLLKLSVSREVDKLDLLGSQKLEGGNVIFEPGIVPIAMEHGCILNLDEINTANPGLLTLLHSATDWSSSLHVPGYKTISSDNNFCLIGTMNENYNGVVDLNQATKDRFTTIRVPYPEKISQVLRSQVETDEAVFDVCDTIFDEILKSVKAETLSDECITVRGYLSAIEVYNEGMDIQEALIDNIANTIDDEMDRENIIEAIDLACE